MREAFSAPAISLDVRQLFPVENLNQALKQTRVRYAQLRPEQGETPEFEMKRLNFLEILLLLASELVVQPKVRKTFTEAVDLLVIEVLEPFVRRPRRIEASMFQFRNQFVWVQEVNALLHANLKGVVELFQSNLASNHIFNFESA